MTLNAWQWSREGWKAQEHLSCSWQVRGLLREVPLRDAAVRPGRKEQSQIPQRCCEMGAGDGQGEELRRSPPIPLAKAKQGAVISLAAKFQNSELIPKTLTVNHVCLHHAVHFTKAETCTVQICTALRGVKHRQIFPGAQPAAAVSSDRLAQVQHFGKKRFYKQT